MALPIRGWSLLGYLVGRVSALGGSASPRFGAPGAVGRALRGFRNSGVRTSREKRSHLPEVATVYLPTCPQPQSSF
ncbi:bifunctional methylenetetrahydrofolate dehydrogenase/cyclohydrolase 2, mitochondrial isoform X2 [Suncus etruscus]|uniref:bifunctional methylenetetrahydrofolate dehydrogenase/cyclohydrolase 2, mitochondrial isoform X2 n=1 Tax=Suncus etruscus TaxID=109475 RepID=UPI00211056D1|nr:bifunctional methylenetetrahydrofolate dehydrogenase/cyclohydrolase 2, mitochondrial isoform X2 [Suncus etruscus]